MYSSSHSSSLIVFVHGGPHRIFSASYTKDILYYTKKGFSVLVPHYVGSIGFGETFLHSLCGHIGDIEITGIVDAITNVVSNESFGIDPNKIYYMGSSYGGFIGLHLLEKFPSLFAKAILRNPVADTVTMVTSSDMTYWMLVLAGRIRSRNNIEMKKDVLDGTYIYSTDDLMCVQESNPISHIDKITTPICLILGGKDNLVINKQAFEVYRHLMNRNKEVKILINPSDNHSLLSLLSSQMTAVAVIQFFNYYIC